MGIRRNRFGCLWQRSFQEIFRAPLLAPRLAWASIYELSSVLTFEVTRSEFRFCHLQQRAPGEAIQPCQAPSHNGLKYTMLAFPSKAINVSPPSVNLFLDMERIVKLGSCPRYRPVGDVPCTFDFFSPFQRKPADILRKT